MGTEEKPWAVSTAPNPPATAAQPDKPKMKNKSDKEAKTAQQEEAHKCCGCRFPLLVAVLQLALGVSITVVAFLMAGSCSSLLVRDTPHWAGIIVSTVAILGLFLLCLPYQPYEKTSCQFALKLTYFLLNTLSLIICVMAAAFAAYHYSLIKQFTCEMAADSCHCTLDLSDPLSRTILYQDVADCNTITSTIMLFVLLQMTFNLLLALVCLAACFVMWKDRYQVFYVGLWPQGPTTNEKPQQKV
ncbi:sarcospan [Pelobates fuscus]|uniref:sarcospan n=1 Tax=Pelobates fuscus TaxID=191477 RepID=UPI002FE4CA06